MPQILMPYTVHLDHTLRVTPLNTLFAKGDSAAHRFELTILSAGVQEDLTGCTVLGNFYRMADSTVVSVPGFVEGGNAVVALPAACYDYIGRFALTVAIKKGEEETTVFYGDGYMHGQRADTAISGEYIIYDINTLLEKIAEIDAATQAANTATENANTATSNANTARDAANTAASTANTAATNANTAKDSANAAAAKINNMTVSATPVATGTATAELSTVDGHYHLALGLPKGDTGATPQISVQVQTGEAGSEASVSVSGTAEEPVILLTIPRGDVGDIGALTINGKSPDGSGAVTLEMGDISGLSDAIANAGGVKTVAGVGPDSAGNVALTAADVGAVPTTGGAMTGELKTTLLRVGYEGYYPNVVFQAPDTGIVGVIQYNANSNARRFSFLLYHSDQDGQTTKYCDSYQLPNASEGLTSNAYYSILTSKEAVKITQGGTGAATASAALSNLGGVPSSRKVNGKALTGDITGGVVGVLPITVTSPSITSDGTGTQTATFTEISGASAYYAVLLSAGSVYGWITKTEISGTTLTVTYYNASSASHTISATILIIGIA